MTDKWPSDSCWNNAAHRLVFFLNLRKSMSSDEAKFHFSIEKLDNGVGSLSAADYNLNIFFRFDLFLECAREKLLKMSDESSFEK